MVKHRRVLIAWDVFIISIALYQVAALPIRISINEKFWDPKYNWIDLATYIVFVTDIFLNMRMTYLDKGHEIIDTRIIRKRYLTSWRFFIDIVSLIKIPNFFIPDATMIQHILSLCGLLKLLRYVGEQGPISQSRLTSNKKAIVNMIFYFFLLLVYLHITGCFFFWAYVGTYNRSSNKIYLMDELGLRNLGQSFVDEYELAKSETDDMGRIILAWAPTFDGFGTDYVDFWRMYELARLSDEQLEQVR